MLLAAGHVFAARVICQIGEIADRENLRLQVSIRRDSVPSTPVAAAA
jgi:hypothetical protein